LHPKDLDYIRNMVPNISSEIVLQLKNLKPGNCIAFGSAFKVPVSMYIDLPNPKPLSNNVDLENVWYNQAVPVNSSSTLGEVVNNFSSQIVSSDQTPAVSLGNGRFIQENIATLPSE